MATLTSPATTTLDRPPALDDRALFGHPRGLGLLFVVEMWERFSYYGMRALLVLYLVNALRWTDGDASRLYGMYTGLVYLTPLIGGYLADRFIGTRRSLVVGGIIIALGHFTMAFGPDTIPVGTGALKDFGSLMPFYIGLLLIIIGTGFFKPNVSTMVGQIYPPGDARRDAGFTIFYMGINVGAGLAPLVCGYLGQRVGWHYGFGAAGVGMLLGLIIYLWGRDKYLPGIGLARRDEADNAAAVGAEGLAKETAVNPRHGLIGAVLGAAVAFATGGDWLGYLFGIIIGAALGITILGSRGEERKRVIALFIVVFFVIFFWMAFEQAGSSMNLFADRYTRLSVVGFTFPSSWFQSVNSMFILIFAPIFAVLWGALSRRGREPSTALKMATGLILLGIGFVFLVVGAKGADACVAEVGREAARGASSPCAIASPMWLVMAYLFHTWGELMLSPVGLSYVTKVAPLRFASLLMGVWFLANAAANTLGGYLAAMTENIATQSKFFMIPVATSIGAGIVMFALVPLLKRLTASVKA
ncbi:MAG TPA: peptide MFS transporter [Gemmatimonadaceae bacterium]|nr:peptide MFS transporter [Gemmatimonadaceae bacterium]